MLHFFAHNYQFIDLFIYFKLVFKALATPNFERILDCAVRNLPQFIIFKPTVCNFEQKKFRRCELLFNFRRCE